MSQKIEKNSFIFYMLHSKLIELLFVKLISPALGRRGLKGMQVI